jgi:serpin B
VPDDLASFQRTLSARSFAQITSSLASASVNLSLPRFKTETKTSLAAALALMGMPLAMNPDRAVFFGITTDERLFIGDVVHQANIDVNEKGTDATAATAVLMVASAAPAQTVTLKVNKPFFFVFRDTKTGAILFLGRIVDPSAA